MNTSKANFDRLAYWYDWLVLIVFGNTLKKAQLSFLDAIKSNSTVLILGGGTGYILSAVKKLRPNCTVCFIDSSPRMIDLTKNCIGSSDNVTFVVGTEEDIPSGILYEVVITNFYLDLFSPTTLSKIIQTIKKSLQSKSIWLVTDFVDNGKVWQNWMLKCMYFFFRKTCSIEATNLPLWLDSLRAEGLCEQDQRLYCRTFVKSSILTNY